MAKRANFLHALLAASALMLPAGCARITGVGAPKEAAAWQVEQGKETMHLTRLQETPEQLINRLADEGHNVIFLPEWDHREIAVLEAISKHCSRGTALITENKDYEEFNAALEKYRAGDKEPLLKIIHNPRDYHAPDESRGEARERYYKAKEVALTGPLDKGIKIVPMDMVSDFPEAIAATEAANEKTAFSCAAHLFLAMKDKGVSLAEMKENRRHRNHAEQFSFGELLNAEEKKELADILGLKNLHSLKEISTAIGDMNEAAFGKFKDTLCSHLSRITGKGDVLRGTTVKNITDVLQKGLNDFIEKQEKAEDKRDVIREARMSDRIVEVFRQQVKEGKKPLIIVTGGRGHVEHVPGKPGGRKDLDEMVVDKEPAIKPAVVCFVPIKPEKMEGLPHTDGVAVFYAGKEWYGAGHVCLVAAENFSAICKITPAPEVAPNRAEIEKSERFREQNKKIATNER